MIEGQEDLFGDAKRSSLDTWASLAWLAIAMRYSTCWQNLSFAIQHQ